ncbi:hypothetical protein [Streptosporangium carneum]|uniref:Uncharacterized protein n=1 Tax=Streptosporangium carneum TaxID=47481 RepID=A0A9W6HYF5_9ACTN|nr:hypothetical protein [Streptosporangium carneum]GLK08626.1 hypothetical protein GCM10017600_20310 [Streptosporangium carneum]
MATEATDPPLGDRGFGPLIQFAGQVLASAGLLTAVLYYFGYVREKAFFGYFGVDLGSAGLSTTDYLVRSAGPLFSPLVVMVVTGVAAIIAHHVLAYLLSRANRRRRRIVWATLGAIALVLLMIGAIGLNFSSEALTDPLLSPLALGVGALLLGYAAENAWTHEAVPEQLATGLAATRTLRRTLIVSLALGAAFWATTNKAYENGTAAARAIESSLPFQSQAIVYSRDRLQISGLGVRVRELGGSKAAFTFRYSGLRLLMHTGGHWFLLPATWRRHNGETMILLPDSRTDIRVELAP